MIRIEAEVIEKFNLKTFDKLENIKRVDEDIYGTLFVGDTFDCDEAMYDYLMGNNPRNKVFIKKIKIKEVEDYEKVKKDLEGFDAVNKLTDDDIKTMADEQAKLIIENEEHNKEKKKKKNKK